MLDRKQVNVAATKLDEWIRWAQRSRLEPFRRVARTICEHAAGILAYVRSRLNNGRTEALNGRTRVITRRAPQRSRPHRHAQVALLGHQARTGVPVARINPLNLVESSIALRAQPADAGLTDSIATARSAAALKDKR